jgi:hypothetical protein
LTAKVWSGGGVSRLSVPLIFQVEDDPEKDVLKPLMQLMYLSMPCEDTEGGFLSSPGPRFDITGGSGGGGASNPANNSSSGGDSSGGSSVQSPSNTSQGTMAGSDKNLVGQMTTAISSNSNEQIAKVSNAMKNAVKNKISVQIGEAFKLPNVVIVSVSQTQRMAPIGKPGSPGESSGINALIKVDVVFEGFFTLTQRDLKDMLLPMANSSDTLALYNKLIG